VLRDSNHAVQINCIPLSKVQYLVGANRKTSGQSTRQARLISGKMNTLFLYRVFINHQSPEAYRIVVQHLLGLPDYLQPSSDVLDISVGDVKFPMRPESSYLLRNHTS